MSNNMKPSMWRIGNIFGENKGTGYAGNVWDYNGVCNNLTTMQGGLRQPLIIVRSLLH